MKSRYLWWILVGAFVLFTTVSCRTTPPEPEAPPPPPPEAPAAIEEIVEDDSEALAALEVARGRVAAARQLVPDFDGDSFFPGEWNAAGDLYAQAEHQRTTATIQEINESTARYNIAADAFEALAETTLAHNFAIMEAYLIDARNNTIMAGAMALAPDFLSQADNTVLAAYEKYLENDFHAARDAAVDALDMYYAIWAGVEADGIREAIAVRARALVPGLLSEADDAFWDAVDKWDMGDFAEARTGVELALIMYMRAGASTERQEALNRRANVAARQEFDSAQSIFARADTAFQARELDQAGILFYESAPLFRGAAQLAFERQQMAEEALRLANERMAESDETARAAELILEGDI